MSEAVPITDNRDARRLETTVDGDLAELVYRVHRGRLVLVHTGVPDSLGGRGLGGLLVQAAIGKAQREGLTIVPLCPFARGWLERHPDSTRNLAIDWGKASRRPG